MSTKQEEVNDKGSQYDWTRVWQKKEPGWSMCCSLFRLPDLVSLNFLTIGNGMLSEIVITLDLVTVWHLTKSATALSSWYDLTPTNPPARQSISRICLKRKFHSVAGTDYFLRHHTSTTLLQQYFSVAVNDLQVIPTCQVPQPTCSWKDQEVILQHWEYEFETMMLKMIKMRKSIWNIEDVNLKHPTAENCKSSKCESNSQSSLHCYCVHLLEVAWVQLRIFGWSNNTCEKD